MCTLALYFRVFRNYPLIVAANRDEHYDRPSTAPHLWHTQPAIFAGKDLLAGGTWLGVNEYGLVAGILNRRNREPKPPAQTLSRGLLCLDLLGLKTAAAGCAFVQNRRDIYQPFTLVFADINEAWAAYNNGREIEAVRLSEGLHVFSNTGDFNMQSEKVSRAYRRFAQLEKSLRSRSASVSDWPQSFATILGDHQGGNGSNDPREAICVHAGVAGTVSSSLIIYSRTDRQFKTFFCPGPPCQHSFGQALAFDVHDRTA